MVVDLPLVPVMPAKRARRAGRAHGAWNSSSASERIGTPAARARAADRMRRRQSGAGCRARAPARRSRMRPSRRIAQRPAPRRRARPLACRPTRDTSAPIAAQRARRRQAVAAEADHGEASSGEQGRRKIAHRIFSVARPTSARIMEMIQNRITMVGSAQPFFSK